MKRELLLKAFGHIGEKYIAEAYCPVPRDAAGTPERIVRMKKKRIITFALAAALMLSLGIAAYSAGRVLYGWGGNMEIRSEETGSGIENTIYVHTENMTQPVTFEAGRMIFVVNGEHIDITDQVSETQPFIYHFSDDEGVTHYWIVGKNGPEPEHYGFAEYLQPPDGKWTAGYVARTNNNEAPWLDSAREELGFDFSEEP